MSLAHELFNFLHSRLHVVLPR